MFAVMRGVSWCYGYCGWQPSRGLCFGTFSVLSADLGSHCQTWVHQRGILILVPEEKKDQRLNLFRLYMTHKEDVRRQSGSSEFELHCPTVSVYCHRLNIGLRTTSSLTNLTVTVCWSTTVLDYFPFSTGLSPCLSTSGKDHRFVPFWRWCSKIKNCSRIFLSDFISRDVNLDDATPSGRL